jgi:hypothetical protein
MAAYPMSNSIIKKVDQFGKANTTPNGINFLDRIRVLFEWNNEVDECPEGIAKEDVVLYLSPLHQKSWASSLTEINPFP